MRWRYADGYRPPRGVNGEQAGEVISSLAEPTPENLLEASKRKRHALHDTLWSEGDQVWANRGRLDYCRRFLASVVIVQEVGDREVEIRAVEYVRSNGEGHWFHIEDIRKDPDLRDAYINEVHRLLDQASAKLKKAQELMRG